MRKARISCECARESQVPSRLATTICTTTFVALIAFDCLASGTGFFYLKDAPIAHMTEPDFAIAVPVVRNALDQGSEGSTYRWENPVTGASGSITPRGRFSRNAMACRAADFTISAGGRSSASSWKLCNTADGWKVVDE
jgi:hypothetical protein